MGQLGALGPGQVLVVLEHLLEGVDLLAREGGPGVLLALAGAREAGPVLVGLLPAGGVVVVGPGGDLLATGLLVELLGGGRRHGSHLLLVAEVAA